MSASQLDKFLAMAEKSHEIAEKISEMMAETWAAAREAMENKEYGKAGDLLELLEMQNHSFHIADAETALILGEPAEFIEKRMIRELTTTEPYLRGDPQAVAIAERGARLVDRFQRYRGQYAQMGAAMQRSAESGA